MADCGWEPSGRFAATRRVCFFGTRYPRKSAFDRSFIALIGPVFDRGRNAKQNARENGVKVH